MLSSSVLMVFASETGAERSASFINFYQDSDATLLDMKNLSNQDYYAMFLFMTNWFEPGKTKFSDMYNPSTTDGSFFSNFVKSLGKDPNGSDGETLKKLVTAFAEDTFKGFTSGGCTLLTYDGQILKGTDLLNAMVNSLHYEVENFPDAYGDSLRGNFSNQEQISAEDSVTGYLSSLLTLKHDEVEFRSSTQSKVYFGDTKHLAFDFSEDTIRAAFQTVLAYNPDLFLQNYGIEKCQVMFLDAVGNLWGCTDSSVILNRTGYERPVVTLDTSKMNSIYLILPACLNPSSFTPNVANKNSQSDLRMPLMNRFVLSSMLTDANELQTFQSTYVPIYNLLHFSNKQQILTVLGLKTLSPYTLNTGNIESSDSNKKWNLESRKQDLASFLYDYSEIAINTSKSKEGQADIDSYAYIAFTMNLRYLGSMTFGPTAGEHDVSEGMLWWKEKAFSISLDATNQKKLLIYFFNPTLLPFDKVSMNFYRYDANAAADAEELDDFLSQYISNEKDSNEVGAVREKEIDGISTQALANKNIAELGLAGMGLFIEDIAVYAHDNTKGSEHIYVTPSEIYPSKFVKDLRDVVQLKNAGVGGAEKAEWIEKNGATGEAIYALQERLFLNNRSTVIPDESDILYSTDIIDFFITEEDTQTNVNGTVNRYLFGNYLKTQISDLQRQKASKLSTIDDLLVEIQLSICLLAETFATFFDYEEGVYHETLFGLNYSLSLLEGNDILELHIGLSQLGKDYELMITDAYNAFEYSLPISFIQNKEFKKNSVVYTYPENFSDSDNNGFSNNYVKSGQEYSDSLDSRDRNKDHALTKDDGYVFRASDYNANKDGIKTKYSKLYKTKDSILHPEFAESIYAIRWSWNVNPFDERPFGLIANTFWDYLDLDPSKVTKYTTTATLETGEKDEEDKPITVSYEDVVNNMSGGTGDSSIEKYLYFETSLSDKLYLYIAPSMEVNANIGNNTEDITLGTLLGANDTRIRAAIASRSKFINSFESIGIPVDAKYLTDYVMALYGYSVLLPAKGFDIINMCSPTSLSVMGKSTGLTTQGYTIKMGQLGQKYLMGMYLGYIVDTMGLGTAGVGENQKIRFNSFYSPFLPSYDNSAEGGNMTMASLTGNSISGVEKSEDLSFEEKQKNLIDRIYGLTNDSNNEYRNSWIKNIIEGFFLTIHRTITGTWGTSINTITSGSTSTYQSVTGYIYTPTLEELSFTATLMNNYIKIYIVCLMCVFFIVILMVLLHMRTWQEGLITCLVMCVALLFPYILISNSISIGNKISNTIYSDRFDFWAMTEHQRSLTQLVGVDYMTSKDLWMVEGSATTDVTLQGQPGVKIKWMSPKKVDMFQNLYSDPDLSTSFVTNIEIFKWLFNSFIYDSEFVDTDVYGSFVYRSYNSIALEAKSYYQWGKDLMAASDKLNTGSTRDFTYNPNSGAYVGTYGLPKGFSESLSKLQSTDSLYVEPFLAGMGSLDKKVYSGSTALIKYSDRMWQEEHMMAHFGGEGYIIDADLIPLWGLINSEITEILSNPTYRSEGSVPGIYSNLPELSAAENEFQGDTEGGSMAIFLKNTESPFYYFYSVLKMRYGNEGTGTTGGTTFKKALLEGSMFAVTENENRLIQTTDKNLTGVMRDYLDMQGLFEYVIPYMKLSNEYVTEWQKNNYSEIEEYNFEYELDSNGSVDMNSMDGQSNEYKNAVIAKNNLNRVWNMYCPWVDTLYDLDVANTKITYAGKTKYIVDSLNPSSYLEVGRPMVFSAVDMEMKGLSYKDLTDVERRIQAVLENTYKDMLYLINYYDMNDEVLLVAGAMYATFNFNQEFSQNNLLGESVELYPQGLELKNFNYDAFMRLALLNATGENVFGTSDLYERVLAKTNIFTGLLLILCDLVACIIIPAFKFIMLIGLLFLGVLVCVSCVVNPPDKIMKAVSESVLLPTVLFMLLNIIFSWVMSFVVGEGLTTYVGSKGVNFATNDPTMTMLVIAALGIIYTIFAFKILKMLVKAYKKFGMTSVFATMGILSSAVTASAGKVMRGAGKLVGSSVGAAVGFATAEKGERLAGAFEGGTLGSRRVINQRIRDKRYREMMKHSGGRGGGVGVTDEIDAKASGSSVDLKKTDKTLAKPTVEKSRVDTSAKPKVDTPVKPKVDTSAKPKKSDTPSSVLDGKYQKVKDKNANLYGRYLSHKEYKKAKAADALNDKEYQKKMHEMSLREKKAKDALKKKEIAEKRAADVERRRKAAEARKDRILKTPERMKQKFDSYKEEGRKSAQDAANTYSEYNKARDKERKNRRVDKRASLARLEKEAGIAPVHPDVRKREAAKAKAEKSLKNVKKK